jgi:hypothetical protein
MLRLRMFSVGGNCFTAIAWLCYGWLQLLPYRLSQQQDWEMHITIRVTAISVLLAVICCICSLFILNGPRQATHEKLLKQETWIR